VIGTIKKVGVQEREGSMIKKMTNFVYFTLICNDALESIDNTVILNKVTILSRLAYISMFHIAPLPLYSIKQKLFQICADFAFRVTRLQFSPTLHNNYAFSRNM